MVVVYFFYRSAFAILYLSWLVAVILYREWKEWQNQTLLKIEEGFREWIYYIKGALQAGKSIEKAMLESRENFDTHLGNSHPMRFGLEQVYRGLELHVPVEACIERFAEETKLEIIADFAVVFRITKKQGGHMASVLEHTITQIYERAELRGELHALFAAKRMEQRVMCVMPFAIILFIGSTSKGYFDSLYHNLRGVCIMSASLAVYLLGIWWGEKLTEVKL